jgi:hypothetical protein
MFQQLVLYSILLLGFPMGNPWVGFSHTAPKPPKTVPVRGMGTKRTVIHTVYGSISGGGGSVGNHNGGVAVWPPLQPRNNPATTSHHDHRRSLLAATAAAAMTTMIGSGALRP